MFETPRTYVTEMINCLWIVAGIIYDRAAREGKPDPNGFGALGQYIFFYAIGKDSVNENFVLERDASFFYKSSTVELPNFERILEFFYLVSLGWL